MGSKKDKLKSDIIQGFGTLIAREFLIKIFSFLGQIFLARILAPAEFGVYVIISFVISIFGLFSDAGFSLAIIQKKNEPSHRELSDVFYLKTILSLGLVIVIFICAPVIKSFYSSFTNENVFMLRVFSLVLLIGGIRTVPISLLERKIKYQIISFLDIVGVFAYYVATLIGAFSGLGVWSFIFGAMVKEIIETALLYFVEPFIPQLRFSLKNTKEMMRFGIFIQGNGLVNFLRSSVSPVIVGRLSGPYAVGLLDFAFNIGSLPETIAVNFGRVAFAGYSRIQGQKTILLNSIRRSISMLSLIIYIFPIILLCFGSELVPLVFSEKWSATVPALYWYAMSSFFLPIIASVGQGILSIGKSKEIFFGSLTTAIGGWIGAVILVSFFGFVGVAITYFFTSLTLCLYYIYLFKRNDYKLQIIYLVKYKAVGVFCVLCLGFALNSLLVHSPIALMIKILLMIVAYIVTMFVLAKNDSQELLGIFMNLIFTKKDD